MAIKILDSFKQFCEKYPSFNLGGIRFQRFNEDTNGAKELGVFVSIGSRVYVNPPRYFLWAELQTTGELRDVVKLIQTLKKSGKYLSPEDAVAQIRGRSAA